MSARRIQSRGRDPANARARDTAVSASLWSYLEMGGVRGANPRPADNTVPKLAAQRRLHARHAYFERPRHEHGGRRARRGADWRAPSYGTLCIRRTSNLISSHSTTCNGQSEPGEALWPRKACTCAMSQVPLRCARKSSIGLLLVLLQWPILGCLHDCCLRCDLCGRSFCRGHRCLQ